MRDYERKLLAIDTAQLEASLQQHTSFSSSLGRVGELLRVLMRGLGGEDPASVPASVLANMEEMDTANTASTGTGMGREGEIDITSTAGHMTIGRHPQKRILNSLELETPWSPMPSTSSLPDPSSPDVDSTPSSPVKDGASFDPSRSRLDILADKEAQLIAADWALERECELARLERENAVLLQLIQEREKLDHVTATSGANVTTPVGESAPRLELPKLSLLPKRTFKGQLGGRNIGPYGMYKKFEEDKEYARASQGFY